MNDKSCERFLHLMRYYENDAFVSPNIILRVIEQLESLE